jgi:hypothetical protein
VPVWIRPERAKELSLVGVILLIAVGLSILVNDYLERPVHQTRDHDQRGPPPSWPMAADHRHITAHRLSVCLDQWGRVGLPHRQMFVRDHPSVVPPWWGSRSPSENRADCSERSTV